MNFLTTFLSVLTLTFFTACGGGGDSSSTTSTSQSDTITSSDPSFSISNEYTSGLVGKFIDSPVSGLSYTCDDETKQTDSEGLFNCETLPITFSIGNIILGSIDALQADYLVFPQDILKQPRSAALHPEVTKMAVLLQSMDNDANLLNGIFIETSIIDLLNQEITSSINLSEISLDEINTVLKSVIANNSDINLKQVSAQQAQDHLLFSISNNYKSPIQP